MRWNVKAHAPATQRNREFILEVLGRVFAEPGLVLEIASGTGQHAAYFGEHLPHLRWQPSDSDPAQLKSIEAWTREQGVKNVLEPLKLDVRENPWPIARADGIVCINMIHIVPWEVTEALFVGASRILGRGSALYLYGPFFVEGAPTAPSNLDFDESLRARNPAWGVRELDEVAKVALLRGFSLDETVPMPANNLSVIFRRNGDSW